MVLCVSLAGAAVDPIAHAQTTAFRPTSTINNIQVVAEGADQAVFGLTISPAVGSYSTVNSDSSAPAVLLLRSARSRDVPSNQRLRGLVRSVDFNPTDTGLAVRFNTNAPAKVSAKQSGHNRLLVTVTRLTGAEALGSRPIGSEDDVLATAHVEPQPLDLPPGEDSYELVMLKYADVSEIAGLLGRPIKFLRILSPNQRVLTHVTWAVGEGPRGRFR